MSCTKQCESDDDSFIILSTSPNSEKSSNAGIDDGLKSSQLEDAIKDMSLEANMAFKAHFKFGDCPSPASMMVASNIVSEEKSTEELQRYFGEILDENIILKETLKHNNDCMKEQFMLIANCQDDIMQTHMMHKEKFNETRELVEKLRHDNKQLKHDMMRLSESTKSMSLSLNQETGEHSSANSSTVEFVSSPDDDTIHKLTSQLELIEKQRRQVIVDNERLTWQKESLENIVDLTAKERDDLKEKLKFIELKMSCKDTEYAEVMKKLANQVQEFKLQLESSRSENNSTTEELKQRDKVIQKLKCKILSMEHDHSKFVSKDTPSPEEIELREAQEKLKGKVSSLQNELRDAQLKLLDLQDIKLEYEKYRAEVSQTISSLEKRKGELKETNHVVFEPINGEVNEINVDPNSSEYRRYNSNVKVYEKTLQHLGQLLFNIMDRLKSAVLESYNLVTQKMTSSQKTLDVVKMKESLEEELAILASNTGSVQSVIKVLNGIFEDYKEVLKKADRKPGKESPNVTTLSAALVARGEEIVSLQEQIKKLKAYKEERELLKAQLAVYKNDFEAERAARERIAGEKANLAAQLRTSDQNYEDLKLWLQQMGVPPQHISERGRDRQVQERCLCPKCGFATDTMSELELHLEECLDDF